LLAGSPGSGKTIASAQYLHIGAAELGEKGIYVSFAERRETFLKDMLRFGLDFEELEKEKRFRFLDMMACNEDNVGSALTMVLGEVTAIGAKRLVVDSFTAMAQGFKRKIDARIIIHLLEKMVRQSDCTTLLLVEIPTGSLRIGLGIEEFVADSVITLENVIDEKELKTKFLVRKMRGTDHSKKYHDAIITEEGIKVVPFTT